jgi:hypothetical protein
MTEDSPRFRLPRVKWSDYGYHLASLEGRLVQCLANCDPSGQITIVDPLAMDSRWPLAVAEHEKRHQHLFMATTFGCVSHLITNWVNSKGAGFDLLIRCMEDQWSVQEAAATFTQLTIIGMTSPSDVPDAIAGLPSSQYGQPPYLDVVSAVTSWLDFDFNAPDDVLNTQDIIVYACAYAAMQTDCLLRLAQLPVAEDSLRSSLVESVHSRFERILSAISGQQLLAAAMARNLAPNDCLYFIWQHVCDAEHGIVIQPDKSLISQVANLSEWADFTNLESDDLPIPAVRYRRRGGLNYPDSYDRVTPEKMRRRFSLCEREGLGLILTISIPPRDDSIIHALVRTYLIQPGSEGALQDFREDEVVPPLPVDFHGLMRRDELVGVLSGFPTLPYATEFISDSWRRWQAVRYPRESTRNAINICHAFDLSEKDFRNDILPFGRLRDQMECFVTGMKGADGEFAAYCFNRNDPHVFAIQRIRSKVGLDSFSRICKRVNGTILGAPPQDAVLHMGLFEIIAFDLGNASNRASDED